MRRFATLGVLLLLAVPLASADRVELAEVESVDGSPLHQMVPRDHIASIDEPEFVPAARAKSMKDEEAVIGVVHDGVAKAYSLRLLDKHELVNDSFGEAHVTVSW